MTSKTSFELDKATCEILIKALIHYSQYTKKENARGIETACLLIQVIANTKIEIPDLSNY